MNTRKTFFDVLENQIYNLILNASYAGDHNWYTRAHNAIRETCQIMNIEINNTQIEMIIDDAYQRTISK